MIRMNIRTGIYSNIRIFAAPWYGGKDKLNKRIITKAPQNPFYTAYDNQKGCQGDLPPCAAATSLECPQLRS